MYLYLGKSSWIIYEIVIELECVINSRVYYCESFVLSFFLSRCAFRRTTPTQKPPPHFILYFASYVLRTFRHIINTHETQSRFWSYFPRRHTHKYTLTFPMAKLAIRSYYANRVFFLFRIRIVLLMTRMWPRTGASIFLRRFLSLRRFSGYDSREWMMSGFFFVCVVCQGR